VARKSAQYTRRRERERTIIIIIEARLD